MSRTPPTFLSLGTSNFSALRHCDEIYVDKSELIYDMAGARRGKFMLTRPRRFGKSLLVSTFSSLFKYGTRDFKGLPIKKLWKDTVYPVVRLDFSEIRNFNDADEFVGRFTEHLSDRFGVAGFEYDPTRSSLMTQLSAWMQMLPINSLVVLIDEYDAPMTVTLDNPILYRQVRRTMGEFFSVVKAKERCMRFFFMTGVTKFSTTSVFATLDNLTDISLLPKYAAIAGFTAEEVRKHYPEHLKRAAHMLDMSVEQVLETMEQYYGGFAFGMFARVRVMCPWSVLNFLTHPDLGFQNYWRINAGHPKTLMRYLLDKDLTRPKSFAKDRVLRLGDLAVSGQFDDINLDVLLTQEGYLTIQSVNSVGVARLGYPNKEVMISMAELYSRELLANRIVVKPGEVETLKLLATGDMESIVARANEASFMVDVERFPATDAATVRAHIQVLMVGAAHVTDMVMHQDDDQCDLDFFVGNRHWRYWVKIARPGEDSQAILREGVREAREHPYRPMHEGEEYWHLVLVYHVQKRGWLDYELIHSGPVQTKKKGKS